MTGLVFVGRSGPDVTSADLAGRWIAVQIDGSDVSSWHDIGGMPANIVIGADSSPNDWQINRSCGPLLHGTFTLRRDGSFAASVPSPQLQSCPSVTALPPDLLGAVARTASVALTGQGSSTPRALRFLDSHRRLIALWREDSAIRSRTSACTTALGDAATSDGSFTTVDRIRDKHLSVPVDALPDVSGGTVAIYCWTTETGTTVRYAVTTAGQQVRLRPTQ